MTFLICGSVYIVCVGVVCTIIIMAVAVAVKL